VKLNPTQQKATQKYNTRNTKGQT